MKKLIILFNNRITEKIEGNDTDSLRISFAELTGWVKSKTITKHFFKYREAVFLCNNLNSIPWPFFNACLLRLLSFGKVYFKEDNNKITKLSIPFLLKLFFNLITDFYTKSAILKQIEEDVNVLSETRAASQGIKTLNENNSYYLRSDLWFGVSAGGSVGHIAGVLNNLENYINKPIFFSTDIIPTVKESIVTNLIQPDSRFRDFRELSSIYFNIHYYNKLKANISSERPQLIYQRYSVNNYSGAKLSIEENVPFILEFNGSEVWINKNWGRSLKYEELSTKIEMLNMKAADLIVVVSQPLKDELVKQGIDSDKILVNSNGVNTDKYSPEIDGKNIREKYQLGNKTVLGFIGTFGAWHGAEVLAEAFGKMIKLRPEYREKVRLMMIGDGVKMPLVKQTLKEYNTDNCAILTGIVPQKNGPEHLAACDILVSPHVPNQDGSPFFGSPTKLFEYMAMGKGIVASDLEQIGQILEHDRTAHMVRPGNIDDLINGMIRLIEDTGLRHRLGQAARNEAVDKYTWNKHTGKIIWKLNELIKKQE